jgi:hypothetical protein
MICVILGRDLLDAAGLRVHDFFSNVRLVRQAVSA